MAALSNLVGQTVLDFIDYALVLVTIMVAWYAVKFFMVAPPTKEEKNAALQETRDAWGNVIKKAKEHRQERKERETQEQEKQRKVNLASPIVRDVRRTVETAEEALHHFDDINLPKLKRSVKELNGHLHDMWTHASQLRRKVKDAPRRKVEEIIVHIQTARQEFGQKVKGKIPATASANWHQSQAIVRDALDEIRQLAGDIFNKVEEFEQ